MQILFKLIQIKQYKEIKSQISICFSFVFEHIMIELNKQLPNRILIKNTMQTN